MQSTHLQRRFSCRRRWHRGGGSSSFHCCNTGIVDASDTSKCAAKPQVLGTCASPSARSCSTPPWSRRGPWPARGSRRAAGFVCVVSWADRPQTRMMKKKKRKKNYFRAEIRHAGNREGGHPAREEPSISVASSSRPGREVRWSSVRPELRHDWVSCGARHSAKPFMASDAVFRAATRYADSSCSLRASRLNRSMSSTPVITCLQVAEHVGWVERFQFVDVCICRRFARRTTRNCSTFPWRSFARASRTAESGPGHSRLDDGQVVFVNAEVVAAGFGRRPAGSFPPRGRSQLSTMTINRSLPLSQVTLIQFVPGIDRIEPAPAASRNPKAVRHS